MGEIASTRLVRTLTHQKPRYQKTFHPLTSLLKNIKKDPEIIFRVHTRFSGINKFKVTQAEEILLLPKVELNENEIWNSIF